MSSAEKLAAVVIALTTAAEILAVRGL